METLFEIYASEIEAEDTIELDTEVIEVLETLESDDISSVSFRGHSLSSGMVRTYTIPHDACVNVLGA